MKKNKPFTAKPPHGVFLEIITLDKEIDNVKNQLKSKKVLKFSELSELKELFNQLYKKRTRLTLYAQRALQPSKD